MPRGDGTGPAGMGPMTGRGAGYCAGYVTPGFANPYMRGGMNAGFGRGRGRGYRNMYYATGLPAWARYNPNINVNPAANPVDYNPENEIDLLKEQAQELKEQLEIINSRINDLKVEDKTEEKE